MSIYLYGYILVHLSSNDTFSFFCTKTLFSYNLPDVNELKVYVQEFFWMIVYLEILVMINNLVSNEEIPTLDNTNNDKSLVQRNCNNKS